MSIWTDLLLSDSANYQDIVPILLQLSQKKKKKDTLMQIQLIQPVNMEK